MRINRRVNSGVRKRRFLNISIIGLFNISYYGNYYNVIKDDNPI